MYEVNWKVGNSHYGDYFNTLPEALRFVADQVERKFGVETNIELVKRVFVEPTADTNNFVLLKLDNA